MASLKIFWAIATAFLLSFTVNAEISEKVSVEYATQPEVIKPGTAGYIQLKITNPSTETIGYLYLTRVEADSPVKVYDVNSKLGALYPGGVKSVILKFEVPETAEPGFYVVKVFLSANYIDYTSSLRFDIPLEVKGESFLRLSVAPATIEAEEIANVTLVIQNTGSDLRDLRIFWSGEGIVPIGNSSNMFIQHLKSGDRKEVPLSVRAGGSGTAVMKFEVSYLDSTGNQRSETYSLGMEVKSREEDYLRVALRPEVLETGRGGRLVFDISNEGSEELRNILLSWESDVLLPASSNSEFLKSVEAGESRRISFDVLVDENTKPGYYPLAVSLKYDSSGRKITANRTFGIKIAGDVSLVATIFRTEADRVFVSIANTGNAPAKNLVAIASSPYGRAEVFIGDLEAGDEEIVEVGQSGIENAEQYNLSLRLLYRDVFNQEFDEEKRIEVHHPNQRTPLLMLAGGAILFIAIASGIWFWRKR
jgi:hypothetical protein